MVDKGLPHQWKDTSVARVWECVRILSQVDGKRETEWAKVRVEFKPGQKRGNLSYF